MFEDYSDRVVDQVQKQCDIFSETKRAEKWLMHKVDLLYFFSNILTVCSNKLTTENKFHLN